jgi:hypothetical protein
MDATRPYRNLTSRSYSPGSTAIPANQDGSILGCVAPATAGRLTLLAKSTTAIRKQNQAQPEMVSTGAATAAPRSAR